MFGASLFRLRRASFLLRRFHSAARDVEDLRIARAVGHTFADFFPEDRAIREDDEYGGNGDIPSLHGHAPLQSDAKVDVFEQGKWQFEGLGEFR